MTISPLIADRLMTIDEPHLIERYNKALAGFGFKPVKLKKFAIDICGYSPEVAKALGDPQYLDPGGVNRRFIIVSPGQQKLPVAQASFSNTLDLMQEFFTKNLRALQALTIKDVVFGEIEDSVFEVDDIDDLLSIAQVEFKVSTPEGLPAKSAELTLMIDRLLKQPEAWRDDAMLKTMVKIAKQTGDIRDNELLPSEVVFRHETFWSAHFGGIYIFNDEQVTTVVCDASAKGFRKSRPWQVSYIDMNDRRQVYRFLSETGRLDPPRGSWIERSGLLDLRTYMLVVWLAAGQGAKLPSSLGDNAWAMRWIKENGRIVDKEGTIELLKWVGAQVANWSNIDMDDIHPNQRFVLCRANPDHEDMNLVNRLISRFIPFDFMTQFIFNKPNFHRDYEEWPGPYKKFVADVLERYYLNAEAETRAKLYY